MNRLTTREKHGMVNTKEYNSWRGMLDRCRNSSHSQYKDYGARGITVCQRWVDSFLAFFQDMGPRPANTSIERRRNSEGYTPENCYWATRQQQARNKRNNRWLTLNGETRTLGEWAKELGIAPGTLSCRLDREKWSIERALTTTKSPPRRNTHWLEYGGRRQSLTAWAKELGTSRATIVSRLKAGMTVAEAVTRPLRKYQRSFVA